MLLCSHFVVIEQKICFYFFKFFMNLSTDFLSVRSMIQRSIFFSTRHKNWYMIFNIHIYSLPSFIYSDQTSEPFFSLGPLHCSRIFVHASKTKLRQRILVISFTTYNLFNLSLHTFSICITQVCCEFHISIFKSI